MKNSSRTIMAVIAVIVGLMLIFMASGMIDATQDKMLNKMTEGAKIASQLLSLRSFRSTRWPKVPIRYSSYVKSQ